MEFFTLSNFWFVFFAGYAMHMLIRRGLDYIGNLPEGKINGRNPEATHPKPPPPPAPPAPAHHALSMLIENAQKKTTAQIEDSEKRIIFALNNSVNSPMPEKTIEKSVKPKCIGEGFTKWDYPTKNKSGLNNLDPDFDLPIDTKIFVWDDATCKGKVRNRCSKGFNGNLDLLVFRAGETSKTASEFPEVAHFWEIAEGENKGDRNF